MQLYISKKCGHSGVVRSRCVDIAVLHRCGCKHSTARMEIFELGVIEDVQMFKILSHKKQ